LAAKTGCLEALEKLWVWVKEANLNGNELKYKLLLAKDQHGHIAWDRAAKNGNLRALETLWNWAKEVDLNPDELKN